MYLLKYIINQSNVRKDGAYFGRILTSKTLELDDISRLIAERGSTLTETDVYAVLRAESEVIADSLLSGFRVSLPHVRYWPGIEGPFESKNDIFRRGRNKIVARSGPGKRVRELIARKAKTIRVRNKRVVEVDSFQDAFSETENRFVTIGEIGRITGDDMKFDKKDPEQGVFFVDPTGQALRAPSYAIVLPKEIVCSVPNLTAGLAYELQLRTRKKEGERLGTTSLEDELVAVTQDGAKL